MQPLDYTEKTRFLILYVYGEMLLFLSTALQIHSKFNISNTGNI